MLKTGPEPLLHRGETEYPHHKRACRVYSQWTAGYNEEEIGRFFGITPEDVEQDVQHIAGILPTRVVIAHNNDRGRILIQRAEAEKYRRLLREALATSVSEYLASGVAPTGPLKEYREAVGMTEKPGGISLTLTQNTAVQKNSAGITSAEDLFRRVLAKIQREKEATLASAEPETPGGNELRPANGDEDAT